MLARFAKLGVAVALSLSFSASVAAQTIGTYSKAAPYEDVKFELSDAIIRRGLVVDAPLPGSQRSRIDDHCRCQTQ